MRGWVARDNFGGLVHFYKDKPERIDEQGFWFPHETKLEEDPNYLYGDYFTLDTNLFLNLKWEDEPIEVEITIKEVYEE